MSENATISCGSSCLVAIIEVIVFTWMVAHWSDVVTFCRHVWGT